MTSEVEEEAPQMTSEEDEEEEEEGGLFGEEEDDSEGPIFDFFADEEEQGSGAGADGKSRKRPSGAIDLDVSSDEGDDGDLPKPPAKKRARKRKNSVAQVEPGEPRIWRDFSIVAKVDSGPEGPAFTLKAASKDSPDKRMTLQIPVHRFPSPSPWLWYTIRQTSVVVPEEVPGEPSGGKQEHVAIVGGADDMTASDYQQVAARNPKLFAPVTTEILEKNPEATETTFEILSVRRVGIKVGEIRRFAKQMGASEQVLARIDQWKRKAKLGNNALITHVGQVQVPFVNAMTTPALVTQPTYYQMLPYYPDRLLFKLTETQRSDLIELKRLNDPTLHIWEAVRHRMQPTGPKSPELLSFNMPVQPPPVQIAGQVVQSLEHAFNQSAITEVKLPRHITADEEVMAVLEQTNLLHNDTDTGRVMLRPAHEKAQLLLKNFKARDAKSFGMIDCHGWQGTFYGRAEEWADENDATLIAADMVVFSDAKRSGVKQIWTMDEAISGRVGTDNIIVLRAERLPVADMVSLEQLTLGFLGFMGDRRHPYAFPRRDNYFFGFALLCKQFPELTEVLSYPNMTNVWQRDIFDEISSGHVSKLDVTQHLKTWKDMGQMKQLRQTELFLCTSEAQRVEIMRTLSNRDIVNDVPIPNKIYMDSETGFVGKVQVVNAAGVNWQPAAHFDPTPSNPLAVRNTRVELITHYLGGKRDKVVFVVDPQTPRDLILSGLKFANKEFRVIFEPSADEARVNFRSLPNVLYPAAY